MSTGDPQQGQSRSASGGPFVVVADDDPALRKLLRRQLEKAGCRVEAVGDGAAALEACRAGQPRLLVTDVHMPQMLGTELLARLRAEGLAFPVLVISSQLDDGKLEECRRHPNVAVLSKPFSPSKFEKAVEASLGKA